MRQDAVITLKSSLSHIGQVESIQAMFHRERFFTSDGEDAYLPTYTGNAMRGMLRDHAMLDMLEVLGFDRPLSLERFYTLFSGGALVSTTGAFTLQDERKLRELMPAVSLFGTALGNHILQGRVDVGKCYPVAKELVHVLPEWLQAEASLCSAYDMMTTESYTRFDDAKNAHYQALFQKPEGKGDAPQQMRYSVETMKAGSRLWWHFTFRRANALEVQAFYAALAHWGQHPVLGGKASIGHGEVILESDGISISSTRTSVPDFSAYHEHLIANRQAIEAMLYG